MTPLLKRVREWVSGWNSTHKPSNSFQQNHTPLICSKNGEIQGLPFDIFMLIFKLLGPKEAARLASVCQSWKVTVYDDILWIYFLQNQQVPWASILFAEIRLRSGFPLRPNPRETLSFMHIYGERARVPGAIIIDAGAGYSKFGWSKYDSPSVKLATFVEFGNMQSQLLEKALDIFTIIFGRMNVKSSAQPLILATPNTFYSNAEASKKLREAIFSALIHMKVPAVCTVNQATLALFASRRTWGILVNIGFHKTQVFPILHGEIKHKAGVVSVKVGGKNLTRYLRQQLLNRNVHVSSFFTVRELKEKLCYVAVDYEAEFRKVTEASFKVGYEGSFTLKQERFQTGEILFHPEIAGINAMGLHQAVAHCIEGCQNVKMKTGRNWFKTIVLAGGTSRLPGLAERLSKELHDLLPPSLSKGIRVITSPYGADAAWQGAKLVGNVSTFPNSWCMKEFPLETSKVTTL